MMFYENPQLEIMGPVLLQMRQLFPDLTFEFAYENPDEQPLVLMINASRPWQEPRRADYGPYELLCYVHLNAAGNLYMGYNSEEVGLGSAVGSNEEDDLAPWGPNVDYSIIISEIITWFTHALLMYDHLKAEYQEQPHDPRTPSPHPSPPLDSHTNAQTR